ncbi:hypothetical protein KEM60_02458 [Austwickia sp. TVS 96-490-7B]|nr:hypothetical protein [Austwickia sp. TVS 96-490-7B]
MYKPIAGERPLHDFPTGTPHASLAAREVAAALIDRAGGWNLIPTTVMRDSTLGPGSLQLWIGPPPPGADDTDTPKDPPDPEVVALHPTGHTPPHWLPILDATTADGTPVTLSHADHPTLASLAVLDVVLNNADRKAGHILRETTGDLRAIDHGLTLHHHPKLRTILWGWQGQPLHAADIDRLHQLHTALTSTDLTSTLGALLTDTEIDALHQRTHHLRDNPRYPAPDPHRPAIPWPPL